MIFLIDKDREFSYEDILNSISTDKYYYPYYKTSDIYLYFINLIKGLVADKPVILLDYDINISEIEGSDLNLVNIKRPYQPCAFKNISDLISAVIRSKSDITIFTSGTTGQPKRVVHNISTLTRTVRCGEKYRNQVWAYAYNPTHMAGLQVFFQAFENQNTLVNVFNCERNYVLRQIREKKITHISATPTFYRLLFPATEVYDSVIRVTLGGEKSEETLYDLIRKLFPNAKINNVYASTEAGSLLAAKGEFFQIPKSLQGSLKVQDGELLIHKSLLGLSDGFELIDDYYHSGDLIEWIDEYKGVFRFVSRKNELINVGGYKVNPTEVETAILKLDGVLQVVVYGKRNSILGNVLCADVVISSEKNMTEVDIRRNLKFNLQDYKIPRRVRFVEEISLTRTGKIKRQ